MPRHAWLTPDILPATLVCRKVFVPDSIEFEAAFRGALLLLQQESNWEQYGVQTPADVAGLWFDANAQTFTMGECGGGLMMPVGTIFYYASIVAPDHCLRCSGGIFPIVLYPELFAVIGYTFGGSGIYFGVPNMLRRIARAYDETPPPIPFAGTGIFQTASGQAGYMNLGCYIVAETG